MLRCVVHIERGKSVGCTFKAYNKQESANAETMCTSTQRRPVSKPDVLVA